MKLEEEANRNIRNINPKILEFKVELIIEAVTEIELLRRLNTIHVKELGGLRIENDYYRYVMKTQLENEERRHFEYQNRLKMMMNHFLSDAMAKVNSKVVQNGKSKKGKSNGKQAKMEPMSSIKQENLKMETGKIKPIIYKPKQHPDQSAEYYSCRNQNMQVPPIIVHQGEHVNIPIQLDEDAGAYYQFGVSGDGVGSNNNVVTKIGGYDYQPMMLKYRLPQNGIHHLSLRILRTRNCCFWFGIIEQKDKYFFHSTAYNNYIVYKLNTCYVISNIQNAKKQHKQKTKPLREGDTIKMSINMELSTVEWSLSNQGYVKVSIPFQLRALTLVPFVAIFQSDDTLCFINPNSKEEIC